MSSGGGESAQSDFIIGGITLPSVIMIVIKTSDKVAELLPLLCTAMLFGLMSKLNQIRRGEKSQNQDLGEFF